VTVFTKSKSDKFLGILHEPIADLTLFLIEVNRNFCPGMGYRYSSVEDDSNDALKTKLHTLIADGAAVLRDI
jgi:hypothetical protein